MTALLSVAPALTVYHRHRGGILIVVLLAAIVGLLIWLAVRTHHSGAGSTKSAREVLAERYARGEIDTEEYQQRREQLS
jgi:putative membrane protein